ncbi:MAG: hypothetical protein B6I24_00305 [Bacteroidetes bacterium 4572_128]|nr:MAG: hypothetical protein B6I24_00305 [Bacteroidetes bacterium 4572_128]
MKKIAILLPCFNEGSSINKFNNILIDNIKNLPYKFELFYIDDGSLDNTNEIIKEFHSKFKHINIYMLKLNYNMGHQKAIYQGMLHLKDKDFDNVLIMDSDGEDNPAAIQEILKHNDKDLVQVLRGKRNESLFFKMFYIFYKIIFQLIIGKKLNFGNYSLLKPKLIKAATDVRFNHLAAFLDNQRCNKIKIRSDRNKRIDGVSKMNFNNLFYHAVNSFAENAENLLFVFIKLSILLLLGIIFLIVVILYKKFIIHVAVLGWTSSLLAILFNSFLISIGVFVIGILQLNILWKQNYNKNTKQFKLSSIVSNWR